MVSQQCLPTRAQSTPFVKSHLLPIRHMPAKYPFIAQEVPLCQKRTPIPSPLMYCSTSPFILEVSPRHYLRLYRLPRRPQRTAPPILRTRLTHTLRLRTSQTLTCDIRTEQQPLLLSTTSTQAVGTDHSRILNVTRTSHYESYSHFTIPSSHRRV